MEERSDQSVNLLDINVVKPLDGGLDLVLVRLLVNDEDEGVVVFDLLHGRLSSQRVLDDLESIQLVSAGSRPSRVPKVNANQFNVTISEKPNVHSND